MRRREFVTLVGGTVVGWPLAARAQQQAMPVVALISPGAVNAELARHGAFRKGLSETGYIDGQNVTVEYHWLEGHYERLPALLADLIRRRVAVIAAPASTPAALAAKAATATVPIVFGVGEDPVSLGLVASLARLGGNMTGVNFLSREVNAKRLSLMHELLPATSRVAVLVNPTNPSAAEEASKELQEAAPTLGLKILVFNAKSADEVESLQRFFS